jgi:hypothetical protein
VSGTRLLAAVSGVVLTAAPYAAGAAKPPKAAADTTPYSIVAMRGIDGKVSIEVMASADAATKEATLESQYQAALAEARKDRTAVTPTKPALIVLKSDLVGKKSADATLAKVTAAVNPAAKAPKPPKAEGGADKPAKPGKGPKAPAADEGGGPPDEGGGGED